MTTRIRYFDIAKGIAILCVILGHSILTAGDFAPRGTTSNLLIAACFTFHMPLFFILSGYFMHPDRPFDWAKEGRQLIATYVITSLAVVAGNSMLAHTHGMSYREAFSGWFAAAVYGAGDMVDNYLWPVPFRIGALWFLLALFWAHLIVHAAAKTPFPMLTVLMSFLIGYGSAQIFWLPFSLQSGMTAAAFVHLGVVVRGRDLVRRVGSSRWAGIPWIVSLAIWFIAIRCFDGFSMAMNQYGNGWHFWMSLLGAVCGTFAVLGVSIVIDRHAGTLGGVLTCCGRNSLALLCVHLFEDDVFPWALMMPVLSDAAHGRLLWLPFFALRLACDGILAYALFRIPRINVFFYPQLAAASR